MIKVSFELINGYVQGWHEVTDEHPAMFENIAELETEEQLQRFNDNYLNYTLKDGKLFYDESHKGFEKAMEAADLAELRRRREAECFSVINRGQLWYSTLTNIQLSELNDWYAAWLTVTDTKIIPPKPLWLT